MIVIENLNQVLAQIETERGIGRAAILSAVEQALVSASRRKLGDYLQLRCELDPLTGQAHIFQTKTVVEEVEDADAEISLQDAQKMNPDALVDSNVEMDVTPNDFGRIAAQTAKQVIIQRIREAEKNVIFDEFKDKVGSIINGTVQRIENRNYLINLGRVEAILNERDIIPGESFRANESIRLYISNVEQTNRGTGIHVSRTHPGFLRKLFELEIPEVQDGIIEVKSVSREPGKRAKVAVKTNNPSIGAVGTCVGHMGGRIQAIVRELGQEKIDVLEWDENPKVFISNALKPAKISQVSLTNPDEKTALVVVPNDQLSLAIGKSGINVRLSVKLTGWKLDIVSETDYDIRSSELLGNNQLSIVEKIRLEKERLASENDEAPSTLGSLGSLDEDGIKVSDLAKEIGIKTSDLMAKAVDFGIEIKSNRSKVSAQEAALLKEKLSA